MKKIHPVFYISALIALITQLFIQTSNAYSPFFTASHYSNTFLMYAVICAFVVYGLKNGFLWFASIASLQVLYWLFLSITYAIQGANIILSFYHTMKSWLLLSLSIVPSSFLAGLLVSLCKKRISSITRSTSVILSSSFTLLAGIPVFLVKYFTAQQNSYSLDPYYIILFLTLPVISGILDYKKKS